MQAGPYICLLYTSKHYGLGLAIAKAIAESHKGNIDVRCAAGKVEFIVKFPLKKYAGSTD